MPGRSMIKIRYKLLEPYRAKTRRKLIRKGYCQICGSKLSDEKSIERGIGKGCLAHNVAIILEIVPDDASDTCLQADAPKACTCGVKDGDLHLYGCPSFVRRHAAKA